MEIVYYTKIWFPQAYAAKYLWFCNQKTTRQMKNNLKPLEADLINPVAFSERETQILQLIALGKTSKEIADELYLTPSTVDSHRRRMIKRVKAKNIFGVFNYTMRFGIVNPMIFSDPYLV